MAFSIAKTGRLVNRSQAQKNIMLIYETRANPIDYILKFKDVKKHNSYKSSRPRFEKESASSRANWQETEIS